LPAPAGVRVHVLPWNEPLPASAARWLAEGWSGRAVLDLSHWCVVVPTRQSGRRLREALAALAAEQGQAVFPPRVVLPEGLASMGAPYGRGGQPGGATAGVD
jgi:ATP-dependent helicase/nuclease subunit B